MPIEFDQVLDEVLLQLAGPRLLDHLVDPDELGCRHTLADAEARLGGRLLLYRHLIASGWQPPVRLLAQLERDEVVLHLHAKEPPEVTPLMPGNCPR